MTSLKPHLTVAVHSPTLSSTSSPRSPRMTSLLSALQGIIEPLSPKKLEFHSPEGDIQSPDASDVSPLPRDAVRCTGRVCSGNMDNPLMQAGLEDLANATCSSVDNHKAEDPHNDSVSPPGLLSPVQIGSVPPVPFPHVALSASSSRGDSIDSGYADTWKAPTAFSLSPPRLNQRNSTLDLLSSPFGSPLSRVLPRGFSRSSTWQHTSPPTPRDSIDIVSPVSTTALQSSPSSHPPLESISLVYATQARASPSHARPSVQGGAKNANPSDEIFGVSDLHVDLSVSPSTETPFFPVPSPDIPALKHPTPIAPYENLVGPHLVDDSIPYEGSSGEREEDAPSAVEGIVEASPTSEQLSSAEPGYVADVLSLAPPSMDTIITSPPRVTVSLRSPISLKTTSEVGEFDYEALYQSLVMSPEEAASKRKSWASRSFLRTLPTRAASAGSSSADRSTSALIDIPERPQSTVEMPPWSRQWDLRVTPLLVSEYTSPTSSPLLETPMSSASSQAAASVPFVHASIVSLSTPSPEAHSPSTYTSKYSGPPTGNDDLLPQSASVSAPSRDESTTPNDCSITEPARSKWDHVSTSRRVPFGFRHSLVVCSFSQLSELVR